MGVESRDPQVPSTSTVTFLAHQPGGTAEAQLGSVTEAEIEIGIEIVSEIGIGIVSGIGIRIETRDETKRNPVARVVLAAAVENEIEAEIESARKPDLVVAAPT